MDHKSDSAEQQDAEREIVEAISRDLGVALGPKRVDFDDSCCNLDGFGEHDNMIVLVECYARVGTLKGSQPDKVLSDILKLGYCADSFRKRHGSDRVSCFFVFGDRVAHDSFSKGWRRQAVRWLGVETKCFCLSEETRKAVLIAQSRQQMVNPD